MRFSMEYVTRFFSKIANASKRNLQYKLAETMVYILIIPTCIAVLYVGGSFRNMFPILNIADICIATIFLMASAYAAYKAWLYRVSIALIQSVNGVQSINATLATAYLIWSLFNDMFIFISVIQVALLIVPH